MYVDAYFDSEKNKVLVSEIFKGKTILQEYQPELFFYLNDPKGKYTSTFGDKLSKLTYKNYKQFSGDLRKYRSIGRDTFEGNIRPLFKTLEKYYQKQTKEKLHKTFFDIEVDWCPERGFAPPNDPFNRITAISVYNDWENTTYSLTLHPKGMTREEAELALEGIENNLICDDEEQMLTLFFELIKDTNVMSGWNSALFDIPYLINRAQRIMGRTAPTNFCLWNKYPIKRTVVKYEKEHDTFDLIGRVHLDLMDLYQKYTYIEQPSYSLDSISDFELNEKKVEYQGTLDMLYNNDYRKFILYSRQDTELLKKLDDKMDHINLAFAIAHENLVDIKTTMGAVALSDNALLLEAHRRGLVMKDRKNKGDKSGDSQIAGAWVADPEPGLYKNIATTDLNSLYPSTYRALNLGNETIVGQIEHTITGPMIKQRMEDNGGDFAKAWAGIFWIEEVEHVFNKSDFILSVKMEGVDPVELPAHDVYSLVFDNDLTITANGTLIRNDKQSIYSSLLERWFNDRVIYQKRAKTYEKISSEGIKLPDDILKALS